MHAKHPEIAKRWDKEEDKESYKSADPSRKRAIRKRLMSSMSKAEKKSATGKGQKFHKTAKYSPPQKKIYNGGGPAPVPPKRKMPDWDTYVFTGGGPAPVTRDKPRKYVAL